MKSTLVLYRKGLCGFVPVLGFALEEKLRGAKCCKFYRPEGVYAQAVHANHMIQYHMHEISKHQQVVDEYRFMADEGREMIPLESDKYKSDPVVNQHIMQMIDTDIHWYKQTFREITMDLRKIRNGETLTKTSKESNETAMMCWESLDDSEQVSNKQKTHAQDDETNDNDNEMDNKMPTVPKRTTNMVKHLNIPVGELRLGADDAALTLATQETPARNLVYITNMPEEMYEIPVRTQANRMTRNLVP